MTLEAHLYNCRRFRATNGSIEPGAEDRFVEALKTDPGLLAAARHEIARVTPEVAARCWNSRMDAIILKDIVGRLGA